MNNSREFSYPGAELALFAQARNWKFYVKSEVGEYLVGDVLEIGAGIGGTTIALNDGSARRWLCLEPDQNQVTQLQSLVARNNGPAPLVMVGSLAAFAQKPTFNCILYIDVLEHIDDDHLQIRTASQLVRPGGYIVVLSPAHQWLFSEFDKIIGLEVLKFIHLNDSKYEIGSHLDRHELVGNGKIGIEGFRTIINHKTVGNIPMVMEPNFVSIEEDIKNLDLVRKLRKHTN